MSLAATLMELEIIILSEVRQRKQISYDFTYMWNLKKRYKRIYLQTRSRLMDLENKLLLTKGDSRAREIY